MRFAGRCDDPRRQEKPTDDSLRAGTLGVRRARRASLHPQVRATPSRYTQSHTRMIRLRPALALLVLLAVLPLSGCLFRSRKVERRISNIPLKSATQQELIDVINLQAARIRTLQATVDI